jgi:transposase-like protein
MNHKVVIGIATGVLALALAGGAAFAGPSLLAQGSPAAQATAAPAPNTTPAQPPGQRGAAQRLVRMLLRATAEATGLPLADVAQGLRDGKSLAQIAQEHGKTGNDVVQAARAKLQERLKQAVGAGQITQQRADAALAHFDQAAPQVVNDTALGQKIGRAIVKRHPLGAALVRATAEVTGLQPADVIRELRTGKSLAQIAQEHGKTGDDVLAKLREQGQQRLDKALVRAQELINRPGLGHPSTSGQP